jgi:hypothetical protein
MLFGNTATEYVEEMATIPYLKQLPGGVTW